MNITKDKKRIIIELSEKDLTDLNLSFEELCIHSRRTKQLFKKLLPENSETKFREILILPCKDKGCAIVCTHSPAKRNKPLPPESSDFFSVSSDCRRSPSAFSKKGQSCFKIIN